MKIDELLSWVGDLEWFDLATIVQLSGERRATILNQLSRFVDRKKVISLRRGMYTLAPAYRKSTIESAALANALVRPSYLTEKWALSYYGLIPEAVPVFTSVTSRRPGMVENDCGAFQYRHLKQDYFFGYTPLIISKHKVLVATPEKAMIDLWYLAVGEWTPDRMNEMRFSIHVNLNRSLLESYVHRMSKPRILRALDVWTAWLNEAQEGEVEL